MNSGTRRSSDAGASQPTPIEPTVMNSDPRNPARMGDRGLSTSPAASSRAGRDISEPSAERPGAEERDVDVRDVPAAVSPAAGTGAVMSGSSNLLGPYFRPQPAALSGPGLRVYEIS